MAAINPRQRGPDLSRHDGVDGRALELATGEDELAWRSRSRIMLSPMAAPSIMGLFGFAVATLMVGAWQAGWYGGAKTPLVLWPFAVFVAGVPQFIAAIACLRARDAVALAAHTVWGAFWTAWGILQLLVATHVMAPIPLSATNPGFAFWFIGLAVVTISAMLASLAQSAGLFVTLGTLAAGSSLTPAGFFGGTHGVIMAGGWLFVVSAAAAWYTATAMMLEHAFGRTVLRLFKYSKAANVPGGHTTKPIAFSQGMPGVRVGQ